MRIGIVLSIIGYLLGTCAIAVRSNILVNSPAQLENQYILSGKEQGDGVNNYALLDNGLSKNIQWLVITISNYPRALRSNSNMLTDVL